MLTVAQAQAILDKPEMKWRTNSESAVTHTFAAGYTMLSTLTTLKLKEQLRLVIHEDLAGEIQTFHVDELPGLTEEHMKAVARMGWHLCSETGRMSYLIVEKKKQIT